MTPPAVSTRTPGPSPAPHAQDYRAPRWLPGAHLQTIWSAKLARHARATFRRERWDTPDGDFIEVDFVDPARADDARAPLVVMFHGLEGSSDSHYAQAMMAAVAERGWRGAVAHFRGCGSTMNLAPRAYHSGDSDEIDWVLRRFSADHARGAPLFAVGISLGGNALLKWLGERAEEAGFVAAAAGVSAPQDLLAGATSLSRGFNLVYTRHFLATLKRKSLAKLAQYPGLFDRERMLASRDFFGFDDAVTAPMHGFRSCHDYWDRSSCRPHLAGIRVPTRVINALNDPFLPAAALARPDQVSRWVTLDYPAEGGHVGFAAGPPPGHLHWLPRRLLADFSEHASHG